MLQILFLLSYVTSQPAPAEPSPTEEILQEYKSAFEALEKFPTQEQIAKKPKPEVAEAKKRYEAAAKSLRNQLATSYETYIQILLTRNDLGADTLLELSSELLWYCRNYSKNYRIRSRIVWAITERMIDPDESIRRKFELSLISLTFSGIVSSIEGDDAAKAATNLQKFSEMQKAEAQTGKAFFGDMNQEWAAATICSFQTPWASEEKMKAYCDRFFSIADPQGRGIKLSTIKAFAEEMEDKEKEIAPDAKAFGLWMMELIKSGANLKSYGIGELLNLQDEIEALLTFMDKDESGRVSKAEATEFFLSTLFEKDLQTLDHRWLTVSMLDLDQDGFVTEAEFVAKYPNLKNLPPILQRALRKRFLVIPEAPTQQK